MPWYRAGSRPWSTAPGHARVTPLWVMPSGISCARDFIYSRCTERFPAGMTWRGKRFPVGMTWRAEIFVGDDAHCVMRRFRMLFRTTRHAILSNQSQAFFASNALQLSVSCSDGRMTAFGNFEQAGRGNIYAEFVRDTQCAIP